MPEWSNGAVSKTVVRVTGPRVRIPFSPPGINEPRISGVIYFTDVPQEACFLKEKKENK
jgi:hypothetical protein